MDLFLYFLYVSLSNHWSPKGNSLYKQTETNKIIIVLAGWKK